MLKKLLTTLVFLALVIAALGYWLYSDSEATQNLDVRAKNLQPLAADDAASLNLISREDLPPEGTRSLIDFIMAENNGIPYPFEKMVEVLASYDKNGKNPTTLMVPFSRSLLKGESNLAQPRVVLAGDMEPAESNELQPLFKGRLFMGLSEGADEIELISYNELAGRFEYQLIKDYKEGGTPTLAYAQRSVCLACHANEATIFQVRPWQETTADPAVTAQAIQHIGSDRYHGLPVAGSLAIADRIDGFTDVGNSIATSQRLWVDGCGATSTDGNRCRSLLLELGLEFAMNPGSFSEKDPRIAELKTLQAKSWPAAGVVLANNDLLNRAPLQEALSGPPLKEQLRSIVSSIVAMFTGEPEPTGFDALPPLPAEQDPLTPRPHKAIYTADTVEGVYGVAQLVSPQDVALLEKLSNYDSGKISVAISQYEWPQAPFKRIETMQRLVKSLGGQTRYAYADTSTLSAPLLDGEPPLEISAGSVLEHYDQYCFGCHRGNPSARLNFMGGKSEQIVLDKIAATDQITEALDWERYTGTAKANKLMPPENSWQRRQLNKAIAEGNDPLAAMREAVPSMFEF